MARFPTYMLQQLLQQLLQKLLQELLQELLQTGKGWAARGVTAG